MAKPPSRRSTSGEIQQFLNQSKNITAFVEKRSRLLFAIDATASRQPTWDLASGLTQNMFLATQKLDSLAVQLCYYRGFHEFFSSDWLTDSAALARQMAGVYCEGGHTQIGRLLRYAQSQHRTTPIKALVFIGDAVEENPDTLCNLAGQCGLLKLPLFMFQEGRDGLVTRTFQEMARLSGGATAHFDSRSADTLAALLGAVACYASGGRKALQNNNSDMAKALLRQLP